MKRHLPLEALLALVIAAMVIAYAIGMKLANRPVLTPGPCTMLGIAELADHPGQPFLVIDCEGFQFGVPAVLP